MKLYLVRHGDSLLPDVDPEQPLSSRGKQETEQVAKYLKGLNLEIDEIRHSVKLRAKQTAEILALATSPPIATVEQEGLKPMDPVEPIIDQIKSSTHNIMLVGHLPFMEKILVQFVLKEERASPFIFCASALACLEEEGGDWAIAWAISPKMLVNAKVTG